MRYSLLIVFGLVLLITISCKKSEPLNPSPASNTLYFPPLGVSSWDSVSATTLSWNTTALNDLIPWLESKNSKAFIILKDGKIVCEKYFGTFTADSIWYWASAGKTMTALLTGIAQQEGLLQIDLPSSTYLGTGWTSLPTAKEQLITVRHQLTMTSGLDDSVNDPDCTLPGCLQYKSDPGTRWAYHNAAYTLLDKVIENTSGLSYNTYFQQKIRNKIGMNGIWIKTPDANNVFYSNARSMVRFGLLLLNKGIWDNTPVLNDPSYFNNQINSSQNLNRSYGFLTWLNGKNSFMVPSLQTVFPSVIIPNAPADLYAALGKNDQKIYIVPSQNLVIIRMGNSAGQVQFALSGFDNELWGKLKTIINY